MHGTKFFYRTYKKSPADYFFAYRFAKFLFMSLKFVRTCWLSRPAQVVYMALTFNPVNLFTRKHPKTNTDIP